LYICNGFLGFIGPACGIVGRAFFISKIIEKTLTLFICILFENMLCDSNKLRIFVLSNNNKKKKT